MPELEQERRDAAHAAARDADQMNAMPLAASACFCRSSSAASVMRLRISLHRFDHKSRRVFRREPRGNLPTCAATSPDRRASSRILLREQIAGEFGFRQQAAPLPRARKSPRCAFGDLRPRRDNGIRIDGSAKAASSDKTGRAGTRDREIGRAVNFFHRVMKRRDVGRNFFALIIVRQRAVRRACRKDESPAAARLAATASDLIIA